MKATSLIATARAHRISPLLICMVIAMSVSIACNAQAIIGKWQGVSVKNYFSADYAQQIGKPMEEKTAKEIGSSEVDFLRDHHFVLRFSPAGSTDVTVMNGTWSVSGNQLSLSLEHRYNPQKTVTTATFSIEGNTLVTTAVFPAAPRIVKTVSVSVRS